MNITAGDRLFGLVHSANIVTIFLCLTQLFTEWAQSDPEGAFVKHLLQKSSLCGKLPEGMSFEEAPRLRVVLTMVAIAMHEILDAPLIDQHIPTGVRIIC